MRVELTPTPVTLTLMDMSLDRSTSMGIDQSLTHTGVIVLREGKVVQSLTMTPKLKGVLRLRQIRDNLVSLASIHGVTHVAMEGVSHGSKWGVADAGGLYWIIRMAFFEINRPVLTVAPQTLKKWVTGKGGGEKSEMMRSACRKWPDTCKMDEHQVDAYGLARIAEAFFSKETDGILAKPLTKAEKEVLKTLKGSYLEEAKG